MFWKKRKPEISSTETFKLIVETLKQAQVRLNSLEIEVDTIRKRIKKKLMPEEEPSVEKQTAIDDGFNDLRKLNKEQSAVV